jgi:transposase InsO family protein
MALKVMSVTDLRLEVLREASQSGETVTAVCRRFGISRETYYVYLRRFRAEGIEGLEPRSTVPLRQPQRMPADVEAVICALRKEHPKWGARRIRAELRREGIGPPAVLSIHRALSRNNLVAPGRARPRPATQRFERASPNDLWQIDATRLLLADESEVWVMDILDDHARFCLAARVHAGPTTVAALESFEWAIKRYGLPTQVLSDNGTCFTGRLVGGEVEFERRLHGLGIATIHSRPYHPQTCGKLERFHRTMKEWLAEQPRATTIEELQELLDRFRSFYNEARPHQGIDDDTPAERYGTVTAADDVELGGTPPRVSYPPRSILRKVSRCGNLSFRNYQIQVGSEWNFCTLRISVISGVVHIYYGEELVRALQLDPSQSYYPIGRGRDRIVPTKGGPTPIL